MNDFVFVLIVDINYDRDIWEAVKERKRRKEKWLIK